MLQLSRSALIVIAVSSGCTGRIEAPVSPFLRAPVDDYVLTVSGVRRLSRSEFDASLALATLESRKLGRAYLPPDELTPFDNEASTQVSSVGLVEAVERISQDTALAALADPTRRATVLGCEPTGPNDKACFETFIKHFGRQVLKRSISGTELAELMELQSLSVEGAAFETGAAAVMEVLLQDSEFLYRIEQGVAVDGRENVFRVSSLEMASRLSFLLWGSAPTGWLLDEGEADRLQTTEQLTAAAQRLLADPRAKAQVERFHALWLRYEQLSLDPALSQAMQVETNALVDKVIFQEQSPYSKLFDSPVTYVDSALATHYGLNGHSGDSGGEWVAYASGLAKRKGILSHGAVLSNGAKFGDTSPTQRGRFIRENLLCQVIPKPMVAVDTDQKPVGGNSNCKPDRYAVHAQTGCNDCHRFMDPVGFGLEAFSAEGVFRSVEKDEPTCAVTGQGSLYSADGKTTTTFSGPDQLADLLIETGELENCVTKQLFRFATGRAADSDDGVWVSELVGQFKAQGRSFTALLVAIATHDKFRFRRPEAM